MFWGYWVAGLIITFYVHSRLTCRCPTVFENQPKLTFLGSCLLSYATCLFWPVIAALILSSRPRRHAWSHNHDECTATRQR